MVTLFPEYRGKQGGAVTTVVDWSLTVLTQSTDNLQISTNHLLTLQGTASVHPSLSLRGISPRWLRAGLISFSKLTL